ncbi:MAG: glycosyltransferase family A protein, partial [Chloroflexota bacterium]
VALEPDGAPETVVAMAEHLADKRFDYYVNKTTHGYSLNTRGLLQRVRTPFFAILPHDDMWHPDYLGLLLRRLEERPDASAAHGDWFTIGRYTGTHSKSVSDGPLFERLLTWYLDGAEGWAWHGLCRSEALDKPFPSNEFDGFAVECEWSLHLMMRGPVAYEPRAMYLKREQPEDSETAVSVGWRNRTSEDWLRRALTHNRQMLVSPLAAAGFPPEQLRILELAAETAMIRRSVIFFQGRYNLTADEEARVAALFGGLEAEGSDAARMIKARLHLAISRHAFRSGRRDSGLQHAEAAVACDPEHGDAQMHLARVYLSFDRVTDSMACMLAAARLMPLTPGMGSLQMDTAKKLSQLGLKSEAAGA